MKCERYSYNIFFGGDIINSINLVLRVSRYRLTDKETGEIIEGCKVTYCDGLEGSNLQNSRGIDIVTSNMPYAVFDAVVEVPAYYSIDFAMRPNGKGQPMLVPVRLDYSGPLPRGRG